MIKKSTYQLVNELDAIDEQHQQSQTKVDFAKKSLLLILGVRLEVGMEDLKSKISILDLISTDLWFFFVNARLSVLSTGATSFPFAEHAEFEVALDLRGAMKRITDEDAPYVGINVMAEQQGALRVLIYLNLSMLLSPEKPA
jgi:hypothetical protein